MFANRWYLNEAKDPWNDKHEWMSYDCFDTIFIE